MNLHAQNTRSLVSGKGTAHGIAFNCPKETWASENTEYFDVLCSCRSQETAQVSFQDPGVSKLNASFASPPMACCKYKTIQWHLSLLQARKPEKLSSKCVVSLCNGQ